MLRFDFDFEVPGRGKHSATGEFNEGLRLAILGPSGCGKSTFLKSLCGIAPRKGFVKWQNQDLNQALLSTGVLGYSQQSAPLFSHLNVFENLRLPFKTLSTFKNFSEDLQKEKVNTHLKHAGLEYIAQKFPNELSGGEKKRVSLMRAFIFNAPLLILDEPFSDLDVGSRSLFKTWLELLVKDHKGILLYVTHSEEDLSLANSRMDWPSNAKLDFGTRP